MKLTIRNFRGISHADIALDGVVLVSGATGAGKTSIAQALAAVLCGEPIPLDKLKKSDAGALIYNGATKCSVRLDNGETAFSDLAYPSAKVYSEGDAPHSSTYACGRASLMDVEPSKRAPYLTELLHCSPTEADLHKLIGDSTPKVWQAIQQHGWDGAHKIAVDRRAARKGAWEEVTNARYGKKKSADWVPDGWVDALDTIDSEQALIDNLDASRTEMESAIGTQAVSGAERERLQTLAVGLDDCETEAKAADDAFQCVADACAASKDDLDTLPRPPADQITHACPHCEAPIVIVGNTLQAPNDDLDPKAVKAMRVEINKAKYALGQLKAEFDTVHNRRLLATTAVNKARDASDALNQSETASDPDALNALREVCATAEAHLVMYRARKRALELHTDVQRLEGIIAALAPAGVRMTMLNTGLASFNSVLFAFGTSATWPVVRMDNDLDVTYGGRAFQFLSSGERYRVRVVLAAAICSLDESSVAVFDNLGMQEQPWLDRNSLAGMLSVARALDRPVLVTMTDTKRADGSMRFTPNLATKERGVTYWLEDAGAVMV